MRVQLRIVAGAFRGRRLTCEVHEGLRPTPLMVREALFSILGNAVPDRPFFDLFAGTGAIGLEALSRGGSEVVFVERDVRLAGDIEKNLQAWGVTAQARVLRTDVYRWAERWQPPARAINVFVSPPFPDYRQRSDAMLTLVGELQRKLADDSVLVLQGEESAEFDKLIVGDSWDVRRYGRNILAFWVRSEQDGNHRDTETQRREEKKEAETENES
jgi:16S rRNA (guanine(966)-N(2))-methyltransferase RsmD